MEAIPNAALQPLTSTDPPCDLTSPLASPFTMHTLTQVPADPEAGWCPKRGGQAPLREPRTGACLAPGDSSYLALHPVKKNKHKKPAPTPTPTAKQEQSCSEEPEWGGGGRGLHSTLAGALAPGAGTAPSERLRALSASGGEGSPGPLVRSASCCPQPPRGALSAPVPLWTPFPPISEQSSRPRRPPRGLQAWWGDSLNAQARALRAREEEAAASEHNSTTRGKSTPQQFKTASLKPF